MGWRGTRSVDIGGDVNEAIIITGDGNSVVVHRSGRQVCALSPLAQRPAVPADVGPAALLMARYELVEFTGREDARAKAREWLDSDRRRAIRLVTGAGGQGKSRLALQVAREAAASGWQVMLARHALDGGLLVVDDAPDPLPVPDSPVGVLVVVDYADRWPPRDLLELLIRPEAAHGRIRMLLLGRSAAFWPPVSQTLIKANIGVSHLALQPLPDSRHARASIYDTAVRSLGNALGVPVDGVSTTPDLSHAGYGLTLAVHIAALITVLRHQADQADQAESVVAASALTDPAALSRELLIREVDHWQKMTQRRVDPVRLSTRTMARAVLIATLTRGLPASAALVLLRDPQIGADPQNVLDDHALCYPPSSGELVLEPLYPDRLGEDFIAALLPGAPADQHDTASLDFLRDPTAPDILTKLLTPDQPLSVSALTMLVETSRRWDHVAEGYLLPALTRSLDLLLGCGGIVIERAAPIPALAPVLSHIGTALDRVIGAGRHVSLGVGAAAIQEQLVHQARANGNRLTLAHALTTFGVRLFAVGRLADALARTQEAVGLYRELAAGDRDAYLPNLATSVNNLANRLAEVGRRGEALAYAQEAVDLRRELAAGNRDAYLPNLATSVNNLANRLAEVGRQREALSYAQEAVDLRRELAAGNRGVYLPHLATSVNNLAVCLAEVGRRGEALAYAKEVVDLRRELVAGNRDAYLPDLATSVNNLAVCLAEVGRRVEAVARAQEVVDLYRELVAGNRDAYLPDLVMSVDNLVVHLTEAGRWADVFARGDELAGLHQELQASPARFIEPSEPASKLLRLLRGDDNEASTAP